MLHFLCLTAGTFSIEPLPYLVFDIRGGRGDPQPLQLQALRDEHSQTGRVALVHNVIHQVAGELEVVDLEGERVIGAVDWSCLYMQELDCDVAATRHD